VVLRGFLDDGPACSRWTPDSLAERFGEVRVEPLRCRPGPAGRDGPYAGTEPMTLAAFTALLSEGRRRDLYLAAHSQTLSRLGAAGIADDLRFDPLWFRPDEPATRIGLWLGPEGSVTPMHTDLVDLLLVQVYGTKQVLLASPSDSSRLYPGERGYSRLDPERPDYEAFPDACGATLHETVIDAGDALLLPARWWHHVRALSTSISLTLAHFAWATAPSTDEPAEGSIR
jgi:hypothetical protein